MDCIVHGVAKSPTRLSDFHFREDGHVRECNPLHSQHSSHGSSSGKTVLFFKRSSLSSLETKPLIFGWFLLELASVEESAQETEMKCVALF